MEVGFIFSGSFRHGKAEELNIHSVCGGKLRLSHALGAAWTLDGAAHAEALLIFNATPEQTHQLERVH